MFVHSVYLNNDIQDSLIAHNFYGDYNCSIIVNSIFKDPNNSIVILRWYRIKRSPWISSTKMFGNLLKPSYSSTLPRFSTLISVISLRERWETTQRALSIFGGWSLRSTIYRSWLSRSATQEPLWLPRKNRRGSTAITDMHLGKQ